MESVYKIIKTDAELETLIQYCKVTGYASVDFETNAGRVGESEFYPTELGVSFQPGSGWIIPLGHKDSIFHSSWGRQLKRFGREVIENPAITKYVWNGLFEYRIFYHFDLTPRGRFLDVMLMKYLLNEERPNDLKSMTDLYLPDFAGYDLEGKPGNKASREVKMRFWSNVELEELSKYCALDCDNTLRLGLHFENRLIEVGLYGLFRNLYMPLVQVLSRTIYDGMLIDKTYLTWLHGFFGEKIKEAQASIYDIPEVEEFNETYIEDKVDAYIDKLEKEIDYDGLSDRAIYLREEKISRVEAGEAEIKAERKLFEPLNLGSPKQLIQLLYESDAGFQFPVLDRTKTGQPSTGEDVLLKLNRDDDSGFIDALLGVRSLNKLYSTYVTSVLEEHLTPKNKVHPGYLIHGTLTSRLSSRNPNIQNTPRNKGEEHLDSYIKKMFIAPEDYFFVEIDGSQMELRVAAQLSGDQAMRDIFNQGKNMHVQTAALIFDIPYDLVQKARKDVNHLDHDEMTKKHKAAKVLNFTIFYGAGKHKVAELVSASTGVKHSLDEAEELIEGWFAAFPGAAKWVKKTRKEAKKNGYVNTLFGFKRRLPILFENPKYLQGKDKWMYAEAERQSVNSIIQGSAANMTNWIGIQIYQAILEGKIPRYVRLISTVHDSLEYYIHKDDIHTFLDVALDLARELPEMEKYFGAKMDNVAMKFSAEIGVNWGRMQAYDKSLDYRKFYEDEVASYKEWTELNT